MAYLRWSTGGFFLILGALNALAAWTIETCTGGAADSLLGGTITLPLYAMGWLLIPKGSRPLTILLVSLVPIVVTALVSAWTLSLADGRSACNEITGLPFEMDGREGIFLALWGATCFIFWVGLAASLKMADWNREGRIEQA